MSTSSPVPPKSSINPPRRQSRSLSLPPCAKNYFSTIPLRTRCTRLLIHTRLSTYSLTHLPIYLPSHSTTFLNLLRQASTFPIFPAVSTLPTYLHTYPIFLSSYLPMYPRNQPPSRPFQIFPFSQTVLQVADTELFNYLPTALPTSQAIYLRYLPLHLLSSPHLTT